MIKKRLRLAAVLLVTLCVILSIPFSTVFATSASDISNHWAKTTIQSWFNKGFIAGYPDGSFKPDNNITRVEFMALVNRANGFTEKAQVSFSDVSSTDWYYNDVAKAIKAGYIAGYENNTVKPNNPISRQEAAVILSRLLDLEITSSNNSIVGFKDFASIPSWSRRAINAVVADGYMSGYPDRAFRPTRSITRAESVVVLDRASNSYTYTNYKLSLKQAVDKQMLRNPQTNLFGGGWKKADRNLVEWFINPDNFMDEMLPAATTKYSNTNMRSGPSTGHSIISTFVKAGSGPFFIINQIKGSDGYTWYRLLTSYSVGWVRGDLVNLTEKKGAGIFQFLCMSGTTKVEPTEVNNTILKGKGILAGKGSAFIDGATKYNINEIFLIALALHESGNGTSQLANGVTYNGVKVYNMYGIGATDADPIKNGAKYAYDNGWDTPEKAIIGGAKFVSTAYINNSTYKQDTLYKMRWNPANPGAHQYATDIGWSSKQVGKIQQLYSLVDTYVLRFDIPCYQ